MKAAGLLSVILASFLTLNAHAQTEIKIKTEPPVIYEKRSLLTALMTEADYRATTAQLAKLDYFPSSRRKPENLSADARFGFNLSFGGRNLSWIVDGNQSSGYVFYADWNGNGDLADDTPLKFQTDGGKYFLHYRTTAREGAETYPFEIRLELTGETAAGQSTAKQSLAFYERTIRRGVIDLGGGRKIAFGLIGSKGLYNSSAAEIFFDLNGDGRFDDEAEKSVERFAPLEKYVNLAGASFEYEVARYGESLTLRKLDELIPDRASLEAGNVAPDFSFVDTSGQKRRLSDLRGKIVLVEFWASWCPACRSDAPKLSALYPRLREKNFEIIGVNVNDAENDFKNFISVYKLPWTQTREEAGGRLQKTFRANVYPAYYLIAADGKIIASRLKSREVFAEIEKQLEKK